MTRHPAQPTPPTHPRRAYGKTERESQADSWALAAPVPRAGGP